MSIPPPARRSTGSEVQEAARDPQQPVNINEVYQFENYPTPPSGTSEFNGLPTLSLYTGSFQQYTDTGLDQNIIWSDIEGSNLWTPPTLPDDTIIMPYTGLVMVTLNVNYRPSFGEGGVGDPGYIRQFTAGIGTFTNDYPIFTSSGWDRSGSHFTTHVTAIRAVTFGDEIITVINTEYDWAMPLYIGGCPDPSSLGQYSYLGFTYLVAE